MENFKVGFKYIQQSDQQSQVPFGSLVLAKEGDRHMLVTFAVEDLDNDLLESSVQDEVQNNTQEDVNTEKQKKEDVNGFILSKFPGLMIEIQKKKFHQCFILTFK